MIRRITLENYMSHTRTVIEPAAGLTVLLGPNNCGKSAVLSALQSVCGETASDYMVRHGEKAARVTLETDDDHTIVWQRKGGSTSYTIDGVDVHRVGRGRGGLPDNLHSLLRMPTIESPSGRRFQVHFGSQKDPIFLLDSDSDLAAFFSSSSESERLREMQLRHKSQVASRRAEQRTLESDLEQLGRQLEALDHLEDLTPAVEQAEIDHRSLSQTGQQIRELERQIALMERLDRQTARLSEELSATADLAAPPAQADTAPLVAALTDLSQWQSRAGRRRQELDALDPLVSPPEQADPAPLAAAVAAIDRVAKSVARHHAAVAALHELGDPPAITDLTPLESLGRALKQAIGRCDAARALSATLDPLEDVPNFSDLSALESTLLHWGKAAAAAASATAELSSAERSLADVEGEIVRFVTQHPLCPTCGGPLTASHVMHGGTGHVQT